MNYDSLLEETDQKMREYADLISRSSAQELFQMISYQFGWFDEVGRSSKGKRLRPLLLLLTFAAMGKDWSDVLSAAAAMEFLHNFSLVIDDVEDKSQTRRGKPTIWVKWGFEHGINTGNTLFILANIAINDLNRNFPSDITQKAVNIFNSTCLQMTIGQSLDLSSSKKEIDPNYYWNMISGKTAALLSACTHIGAILGNADESTQEAYRDFGHYLGLAFQVHDDYLGIWGDSALTGKSTDSDLVTGKKSLPVLYGLGQDGPFARRRAEGPLSAEEVPALAEQLAREGAKVFTQETADQMTNLALQSLRQANPQAEAGEALFELTNLLSNRQS